MRLIEIKTETLKHAFLRVSSELSQVEPIALGPNASVKDIEKYNNLHGQIKRRHRDGTIGHIHLKREVKIFDSKLILPAPSKKIPFRIKT